MDRRRVHPLQDTQVNVEEAYAYVADILPDFQRKGETLYVQLNAANILRANLRASYIDDTEITQVYNEIQQDLNDWLSIKNKLEPMLTFFGYTGLGTIPLALLAISRTLIVVAGLLIIFYEHNRIDAHSVALKRISTYLPLSPEDQAIVDNATDKSIFDFGSFGDIGKYLLWGGAIYLAILLFRK